MSAAVISGAIALVRALHLDWDPPAVEERLRRSAVRIDALNPAHEGALGSGRIDLLAAVR